MLCQISKGLTFYFQVDFGLIQEIWQKSMRRAPEYNCIKIRFTSYPSLKWNIKIDFHVKTGSYFMDCRLCVKYVLYDICGNTSGEKKCLASNLQISNRRQNDECVDTENADYKADCWQVGFLQLEERSAAQIKKLTVAHFDRERQVGFQLEKRAARLKWKQVLLEPAGSSLSLFAEPEVWGTGILQLQVLSLFRTPQSCSVVTYFQRGARTQC